MRGKIPAFVALAAAYAVVLQAFLLAVSGAMAASQAPDTISLCASSPDSGRQPVPAGHGTDCLSACLACGTGMAVTPEPGPPAADTRVSERLFAAPALSAAALPLRLGRAHRSRGPPLS